MNELNYLKENYVERIKNASPLQLILITFELTIVNLEDAKQAQENEKYEYHIKKAQDFLMQLMSSLDMGYTISGHLLSIYLYINKMLHEAYFNKDHKNINDSIEMLNSLLSSFEFIQKSEMEKDDSMAGANIYAGFSYKNGEFEEFALNLPQNKFEA